MSDVKSSAVSIKDEFELREKRLKLVYKILYVVVAVWVASFVSMATVKTDEKIVLPMYSFLLSVSCVYIIAIVKYALSEFACMRIEGKASDYERRTADTSYVNIWQRATLPLLVGAITTVYFVLLLEECYTKEYMAVVFPVFAGFAVIASVTKLAVQISHTVVNDDRERDNKVATQETAEEPSEEDNTGKNQKKSRKLANWFISNDKVITVIADLVESISSEVVAYSIFSICCLAVIK